MKRLRITKIEKQQKKKERYSLFVDGEFWMGVHENVLIQFGLYKAQEVTQATLDDISATEYRQSIYLKAVNYLSHSLRTIKEMREYLMKYLTERAKEEEEHEDFSGLIEQTIARLVEQRYLDDLLFSQSYVRTYMTINKKGPQQIRFDLKRKGVDDATITEALREYPQDLELENAQELVAKFIRTKKQLPSRKLKEKIREMLMQKGYDRDLIALIMSETELPEDEEAANELINKEAEKQLRKWQRKATGYQLKQKLIESMVRKGFDYDAIQAWISENREAFED